jgi:hypothetical protein
MYDVIEKKYLGHLPYILGATTLLVVTTALAIALYSVRTSRPTTAPLYDSARVVVFETADCDACDVFRKAIGKPHQVSKLGSLVPLSYYDVSDGQPPKRFKLAGEVDGGPTAVIFDIFGREAQRMGVPKDLAAFHSTLMQHVRRAERDLQHVTTSAAR